MKNISIWEEVKQKNKCPELNRDLDVDVLIIGGGMTGISCAYQLINSNLSVCLVERNEIASGVTSRTTGKLTYLQENIYTKIHKYHGLAKAKLYLDSQIEAINIVNDVVSQNKINCDLEKVASYVFTNTKIDELNKEMALLKKLKVKLNETNKLPNKEKVKKAFYVDDTYVFHPLKYLFALKEICLQNNISIYEDTKIISIKKNENNYICKTAKNVIKAKYIVLALHYPFFVTPFLLPLKSYIEKSYITAFKVKQNYKFSSITISKPTLSTRYHTNNKDNYQLYLSNSHNTSVKENDLLNFEELLNKKNINPDYLWSNKDIITNDALPFIGSLDDFNTCLLATGYNTWGMTNGTIAGKILADIILKKKNKYIELFDPYRKMNSGKIVNFPLILGSNVYSLVKSKVIKNKSWYPKNIRFENREGKNIAIYTDDAKTEHIVYTTCPHFKCSLIFNETEKTWDCPCHGSRFDIDGKCIEGPSNFNITYKE